MCVVLHMCAHAEPASVGAARALLSVSAAGLGSCACSALSPALGYLASKIGYPECDLPASALLLVGVTGLCWRSRRLGAVYVHEQQSSSLRRD